MKPRVGVLRGGVSDEYDVSLKTGATVLESLLRRGYPTSDLLITKDGTWHLDGVPTPIERITRRVDVVWNALHGAYGEDGKVQQVFEALRLPYTGSRALASALGMHKARAKERFREAGIRVPQGIAVRRGEDPYERARAVFTRFAPPYIVKPMSGGSSLGVMAVRTVGELGCTLADALEVYPDVLVEEKLVGREIVSGGAQDSSGEFHPLWPIGVALPSDRTFFDHEQKYRSSDAFTTVMGRGEGEDVAHVVRKAAQALALRHYFSADLIATPRGLYLLEVNTLPGLTQTSAFPKMLFQSNVSFDEFVDHTIGLALQGK